MMAQPFYQQLLDYKKKNRKCLAVLIDPDKVRLDKLPQVLENAKNYQVDFLFIGGSLVMNDMLEEVLDLIGKQTNIPRILFPGNIFQVNNKADGILLLSLISGRNPELLIGQHVIAAPYLKKSGLEILSTGYILVDGGVSTSVQYISNTTPIPADKPDIACSTALAGEMLGLKTLFLDAGSGAETPVPAAMIQAVSEATTIPLLVGGGIRTPEKIRLALEAGADLIVIGDILEKDPGMISEFSKVFEAFNKNAEI